MVRYVWVTRERWVLRVVSAPQYFTMEMNVPYVVSKYGRVVNLWMQPSLGRVKLYRSEREARQAAQAWMKNHLDYSVEPMVLQDMVSRRVVIGEVPC